MTPSCGHTPDDHLAMDAAQLAAVREMLSVWIRRCYRQNPRSWQKTLFELADLSVSDLSAVNPAPAWVDRADRWSVLVAATMVLVTGVALEAAEATTDEVAHAAARTGTPAVVGIILMSQLGQHGDDSMGVLVAQAATQLSGRDRLVVALMGLAALQTVGFTGADLLVLAAPVEPQRP